MLTPLTLVRRFLSRACARRTALIGLPWIAFALLASATEPFEHRTSPQAGSLQGDVPGRRSTRLREGTELVDQGGRFRIIGDRAAFYPSESSGRFLVLENLNLQRIVQRISENPFPLKWRVSGIVTEYYGSNYLLVRSAIVEPEGEAREEDFR